MLIKLVSPRMSLRPMDSEFKRRMSPSLSLTTLAALTPPEHEVTVGDENVGRLDTSDSPGLVGITVNVDTARRAYAVADEYRRKGVPVVLGGIYASSNPEEGLLHADAVCVGEAEDVWERIIRDAAAGSLCGVYRHPVPSDLARTPAPDWDAVERKKYLYTNVICSSRGCPFACDFCYNSCDYVHHEYRNRPVDAVVREIEAMGTKQVMFIDDNFIGDPEAALRLIGRLRRMDLAWHAAVSSNLVHYPELLDGMAASGCKSLFIGFESINPESVRSVNKKQNRVSLYEKLAAMVHERGIMINASLAFGFDHDTLSVFPDTLAWLVANRIETMTAHILTPYPNTRLHKRLIAEGRIVDFDTAHYNTAYAVFEPKHMTREQLREGYLWMYRKFYSFANIFRRMPAEPAQRMPYLLFNFGYRKFGKITSLLGRLGLMRAIGKLGRKLSYHIG